MSKTLLFGLGGIIFIGFFILAFRLTSPVAPPSASTSITPSTGQHVIPSEQNDKAVLPVQVANTSVMSTGSGTVQTVEFSQRSNDRQRSD